MMMNAHGGGAAAAAAVGVGGVGAKGIEDELSLPILLAERVKKAALEADSTSSECAAVCNLADHLSELLRSAARRATSIPSLYDRPIHRIIAEAAKGLERALAFVRRSRRGGILRRVVSITTGSGDKKVSSRLEASLGDLQWLLSIYELASSSSGGGGGGGGVFLSLPPIASTDPIFSWVWSYIAAVQMSSSPSDRAEAAASLANLALDNDRNKKIIIEEGGIPPLLSLLRDASDLDARISAATALSNLATSPENIAVMLKELAVPVIVGILSDSSMRLQTHIATLVSRMAAHDPIAQEEFAEENAIRPLVSLLSFEVPLEDPKPPASKKHASIHSIVQGIASNARGTPQSDSGGCSSRKLSHWERSHHRKEKENQSPEVKLQLKIACVYALWTLSRGCVSNSRKITETKGLLCLSKIIELEKGELQYYCLLTIMEIAAAAEFDADLRRSAFKTNSPAAKSVVDQLQRLAQEGSTLPLQIAAIRAIGSLARTFPARETRILSPLISQLAHWNPDIASEAANALGKFASPENYLRVEHSKAMIEFEAVPRLLRLVRSDEKTHLPALTLLCYIVLNVPKSEALEQSKVLGLLESMARTPGGQHTSIKELLPNAIYHLELYHVGDNSHGQYYAR